MSRPTIWATLGLRHTRDKTAIRRAYAAKLKVVNPEDDAEGFQALRAAYEQAMRIADRAMVENLAEPDHVQESQTPEDEPGLDPSDAAQPPSTTSQVNDPAIGQPLNDHDLACRRLARLVAGPDLPDQDELLAALDQVLDPEVLDDLDVHMRTEIWLAVLIAQNFPRSDGLIETATSRLDWSPERQHAVHPAIVAVARRQLFMKHLESREWLEAMLRGADEPEENQLFSALDLATQRAVLQDIQIRPLTETWLARLIVETSPRSDMLVSTAAARLGWNDINPAPNEDPAITAIRQHRARSLHRRGARAAAAAKSNGPLPAMGLMISLLFALIFVANLVPRAPAPTDYQIVPPTAHAPSGEPTGGGDGSVERPAVAPAYSIGRARVEATSATAGTATLRCVELANGSLQRCILVTATPSDKGPASLDLAGRLRLKPQVREGRPIKNLVSIDFRYRTLSQPSQAASGWYNQGRPAAPREIAVPNFDRDWRAMRGKSAPADTYAPNAAPAIPSAPRDLRDSGAPVEGARTSP